ncbi:MULTISPECIES: phosphoribosylanthranilate isomerase [unclassified Bacillus cereus group]|uniref:phosphoribosylanthranilate isomerase n=1 Tax=unclassified Bacillus cereus group TaxID=2750818 RepID=UPI001F56DFAC|nr:MULTISPECIES: phosphoribosylanthranilate isomerase [unclassified Bacillus cereus group]
MKVKICGITDLETAKKAYEYGADAVGFVFASSKRKIRPEQVKEITSELPADVMKIGVFVNESVERMEGIAAYCKLTHIQLHGDENDHLIKRLNIPSIKAVGIGNRQDVEQINRYETNYILFDSPKETFRGGNGKTFSWELLTELPKNLRKKSILAGGLHVDNIEEAIRIVQPYMVDVSSGVETDGKKDLEKIKQFIRKVKECSI